MRLERCGQKVSALGHLTDKKKQALIFLRTEWPFDCVTALRGRRIVNDLNSSRIHDFTTGFFGHSDTDKA